jgi:hypothetical protein
MCQWAPCRECEHTGFNPWNESCLTCECGDRVNELSLCGVCREPVGEGEWTRHDSRNLADHPGALAPQESMTTNEHKEKQ